MSVLRVLCVCAHAHVCYVLCLRVGQMFSSPTLHVFYLKNFIIKITCK